MAYESAPEHTNDPRSDVPERFVSTDSNITHGMTIVGPSGTGKSELARITLDAWSEIYPYTGSFHFKSGFLFRRLAADVVGHADIDFDPDKNVDDAVFLNELEKFKGRDISSSDLDWRLNHSHVLDFYKAVVETDPGVRYTNRGLSLDSAAVNSAVAHISEDPYFRPHLNKAAARRLGEILLQPNLADLVERPSFVVFDGRNRFECNEMLSMARVAVLGTIVVTCPENVAAARRVTKDPTLDVTEEAERLRHRNEIDRRRGLSMGPTTLPVDIAEVINADELIGLPNSETWFYHAGKAVARDPKNTSIIFRTDKMTFEDEKLAMRGILKGVTASSGG